MIDLPYFDPESDMDQTRRNLPHWHQDGKVQSVTFRLADSLPQSVLKEWEMQKKVWLEAHPLPWDKKTELEYDRKYAQYIDKWLDSGYGSCVLRDREIAKIVEDSIWFYNNKQYIVDTFVVMSNHVHAMMIMLDNYHIKDVVGGWKSFTANAINRKLGTSGQLWCHESYDRMIRNEEHYFAFRRYVRKNIRQGGVLWYQK